MLVFVSRTGRVVLPQRKELHLGEQLECVILTEMSSNRYSRFTGDNCRTTYSDLSGKVSSSAGMYVFGAECHLLTLPSTGLSDSASLGTSVKSTSTLLRGGPKWQGPGNRR